MELYPHRANSVDNTEKATFTPVSIIRHILTTAKMF
jgi:hypothetical protein